MHLPWPGAMETGGRATLHVGANPAGDRVLQTLLSPMYGCVYQQVAVRHDRDVEELPALEMHRHGGVGDSVMGVEAIEACFERMAEALPQFGAVFMVRGRGDGSQWWD